MVEYLKYISMENNSPIGILTYITPDCFTYMNFLDDEIEFKQNFIEKEFKSWSERIETINLYELNDYYPPREGVPGTYTWEIVYKEEGKPEKVSMGYKNYSRKIADLIMLITDIVDRYRKQRKCIKQNIKLLDD